MLIKFYRKCSKMTSIRIKSKERKCICLDFLSIYNTNIDNSSSYFSDMSINEMTRRLNQNSIKMKKKKENAQNTVKHKFRYVLKFKIICLCKQYKKASASLKIVLVISDIYAILKMPAVLKNGQKSRNSTFQLIAENRIEPF